MRRKYINIFLSIVFVVLGVLLYKSTLELKGSSVVTTGFYIKFLAISLVLSALFELVKSFIENQKEKVVFAKDIKRFSFLVFFLIFYVLGMSYLGFITSSFIFLVATMYFMGYKNIAKAVLISIFVIAFVQLLFAYVFEIPLPKSTIFGDLEWL